VGPIKERAAETRRRKRRRRRRRGDRIELLKKRLEGKDTTR
jgi:hypothetical protein